MRLKKSSEPSPQQAAFLSDVLKGLSQQPKRTPAKYLYDERGSSLFEEICEVEAYYPFRTELSLLERNLPEMARKIGPGAFVIEPGCGNAEKTAALLAALDRPAGYAAVEISRPALERAVATLRRRFPSLPLVPVCADYTQGLSIPAIPAVRAVRRVAFFPGSTIGNFQPGEAVSFLRHLHEAVGSGGALLVGVDLKKDPQVLQRAYDDPEGITAAFNLNLLHRLNRELDASFDPARFAHEAWYNEGEGRMEMHLRSLLPQIVRIAGHSIHFHQDETIHTENSYKYTLDEFAGLVRQARFHPEQAWLDDAGLFSVHYCVADY